MDFSYKIVCSHMFAKLRKDTDEEGNNLEIILKENIFHDLFTHNCIYPLPCDAESRAAMPSTWS